MPKRSRSRSPVSRSRSRSRDYKRERSPSEDRRKRRSRSRSHGRRAERGAIAPSRCLGIFGLNDRTTERDIQKIFGDYDGYMNCRLIKDYMSDRNRGFGFLNFETIDDASYVRDRCNGKEIHGRVVRIEYSLSQRATTPTPGMYFGVRARDERGDTARPYRPRGGGGGGYGGGGSRYEEDRRDRGRDYRRSRSPYYRRRWIMWQSWAKWRTKIENKLNFLLLVVTIYNVYYYALHDMMTRCNVDI